MSLTEQPIQGARQRYTIIEELGRGAFGITCEVEGQEDGARYVAKLLRPELLEDWDALELFERELETLASLDHPAIPRHVDRAVAEDGTPRALIMARAPGRPLDALVRSRASMAPEALERMALQLLEVLDLLHTRLPPVLHRDIKPENLLDDGAQLSLVDFGAVALWTQGGTRKTSVGTFGYMAPEQQLGRPVPASDLYSAGVTLLVLASRLHPEDLPLDPDTGELDVRAAAPGLPEPLRQLIHDMTRRGVRARLLSARAGIKRLRPDTTRPAPVTPAPRPVTPASPASPATSAPLADAPKPPPKATPEPRPSRDDAAPSALGPIITLTVIAIFTITFATFMKRSCDRHERAVSFHRLKPDEVRKLQIGLTEQLIARLKDARAQREADKQMGISGEYEGRRWGVRLDSVGGASIMLVSRHTKEAASWARTLRELRLEHARRSESEWRATQPKKDRFDRKDVSRTWRFYPHPKVYSSDHSKDDEQTTIARQRALFTIIPQPHRDTLLKDLASEDMRRITFDSYGTGPLERWKHARADIDADLQHVQLREDAIDHILKHMTRLRKLADALDAAQRQAPIPDPNTKAPRP